MSTDKTKKTSKRSITQDALEEILNRKLQPITSKMNGLADPTALMNSKYEDLMSKLKDLKDNTTSFINEIEQTQKS